jgi:hypothetical protein
MRASHWLAPARRSHDLYVDLYLNQGRPDMRWSDAIHIATSGWRHRHWIGPCCPADLPGNDFLGFCSQRIATVEMNSSFCQVMRSKSQEIWRYGHRCVSSSP